MFNIDFMWRNSQLTPRKKLCKKTPDRLFCNKEKHVTSVANQRSDHQTQKQHVFTDHMHAGDRSSRPSGCGHLVVEAFGDYCITIKTLMCVRNMNRRHLCVMIETIWYYEIE